MHSSHVDIENIVMWVILQNNAGWDCFKTPFFREKHFWRNIVHIRKSYIFPVSWMCKKQTSVSHSSESEIISLDAGLRLDGSPSLDLWDLIVAVLGKHESLL